MALPRISFSLLGAAALALANGACSRDARPQAARHARDPIAAPAVVSPTLRKGHLAVCDSVAALWEHMAAVTVTRSDSTFRPFSAATRVQACHVTMVAPGGLPQGAVAKVYWADSTFTGWRDIGHWDADGPDGFSRTFMRAGVRCQIDFEQDGGDDSDSTYVPSPSVAERTACWADTVRETRSDTTK